MLTRSGSMIARVAAPAMAISCDYLVVGAGASGMSFVDTLLLHAPEPVSVVLLDKREQPGGHWNDAYDFVTLHQSSRNYGVESRELKSAHPEMLASKEEVLTYYRDVLSGWEASGHAVKFVGGVTFDFASISYSSSDGAREDVSAATVVDARYTENDLPISTPPKFQFSREHIEVIPPHELPARRDAAAAPRRYCVLGAGKTGQDTILHLRQTLQCPIEDICWVMPTSPWITARDPPSPRKQITCMELLDAALEADAAAGRPPRATASAAFLQRAFESLEDRGQVYRIGSDRIGAAEVAPSTKFMDATLNAREIATLSECAPNVLSGRGRVASIGDDGSLVFEDGSVVALPWASEAAGEATGEGATAAATTTFVHCTASAFAFSSSASEPRPPIFEPRRITVQEVSRAASSDGRARIPLRPSGVPSREGRVPPEYLLSSSATF